MERSEPDQRPELGSGVPIPLLGVDVPASTEGRPGGSEQRVRKGGGLLGDSLKRSVYEAEAPRRQPEAGGAEGRKGDAGCRSGVRHC